MNTPIDMSQFVQAKSDQLNADDLIGGPRTIRVRGVSANEGSPEQPVSFYFDGDDDKPFKPCKTMRRLIMAAWGKQAAEYVGRSMTLFRDPKVKFGGMAVGGIRISHMSHIDGQMTIALMETKGKRAPHVVKPLQAEATRQQQNASDGGASDEPDATEQYTRRGLAAIAKATTLDRMSAIEEDIVGAMDQLSTDQAARLSAAVSARKAELAGAGEETGGGAF
jgi:hypothetical protein